MTKAEFARSKHRTGRTPAQVCDDLEGEFGGSFYWVEVKGTIQFKEEVNAPPDPIVWEFSKTP